MPTSIIPARPRRAETTYRTELWLPRTLDELFPFYADAFNLETITPPWLRFRVLTPRPIEMRAGTLIDYKLRIKGFPVRWRTEISVWEPPTRFVDQQLRGPYHYWIHEHTFEPERGGTLVRDVVRYAARGGRLARWLMVDRDVRTIFAYRARVLRELFGALPAR